MNIQNFYAQLSHVQKIGTGRGPDEMDPILFRLSDTHSVDSCCWIHHESAAVHDSYPGRHRGGSYRFSRSIGDKNNRRLACTLRSLGSFGRAFQDAKAVATYLIPLSSIAFKNSPYTVIVLDLLRECGSCPRYTRPYGVRPTSDKTCLRALSSDLHTSGLRRLWPRARFRVKLLQSSNDSQKRRTTCVSVHPTARRICRSGFEQDS